MKTKKAYFEYAVMILPMLLALVCVFLVSKGSSQASLPIPMPQSFVGEYSYDRENWFELTDDAKLSAYDGDLYLRGRFEMNMMKGQDVRYYRNHIGVTVYVNGERVYIDAVTEFAGMEKKLLSSMCGREWSGFYSPGITTQDEIEIHLYNPHRYGNESAYRDFLSTLCGEVSNMNLLQRELARYGEPFRIIGSLCAIVSLMILGAAVAAVSVRIPVGGKLLKQGMIVLFAGGFILFDAIDASFWNELVVLNTYGRQLSMMLAVFFIGCFISDSLTGKRKAAAKLMLGVSSLLNTVMIAASLAGLIMIYDTYPWWAASQLVFCPLLCALCALELYRVPGGKRLVLITGLLMPVAVLLDIFALIDSIIWRNSCSKVLFIVIFIIYLLDAARSIVVNHRASQHAAKLEKELENSRISIMLSQIQPHFLYNVLGTIRGLCREDPMQARQALADFSDYLRGNMSALANRDTIHFTSELRHIEAYLRLEKMRMGPKLNILYDIQEKDFFIPPLSIQPLVENAIKHGLFEKGSGTLILHTRREAEQIIISVQDDGIGFDENAPLQHDDHHTHVGLSNVRNRLEKISGGRMMIDSAPGRGTTVTIVIRTDIMKNEREISNEYPGC